MKAYKIPVKHVDVEGTPAGISFVDIITAVILNSPERGSTTEQIIKAGVLYNRFVDDKKKNEGKASWDWWIDANLYATLTAQLDTMKWSGTTPEVRLVVIDFVNAIKQAKEEEVPGT